VIAGPKKKRKREKGGEQLDCAAFSARPKDEGKKRRGRGFCFFMTTNRGKGKSRLTVWWEREFDGEKKRRCSSSMGRRGKKFEGAIRDATGEG